MKASAQPFVADKHSDSSSSLKGSKSVKAVASARIETTTVGLVIQRIKTLSHRTLYYHHHHHIKPFSIHFMDEGLSIPFPWQSVLGIHLTDLQKSSIPSLNLLKGVPLCRLPSMGLQSIILYYIQNLNIFEYLSGFLEIWLRLVKVSL